MADPVAATFRKPFAEQQAAFRLRLGNLIPTQAWDDIRHNAHDRGFMVAGAMKADLLADLGTAVDKAISQGTTLEEFRRDFRSIVAKHGWHGWTGEGTEAGEAWRTRVIYKTNLRTSYAAGRRAQLIAGGYRWWVYRHSGAEHPRLQHLAWDGIALSPDHPFWATNYPPNGWGCGCEVYGARTDAGIRRVGGIPGKQLPDGWNARDPRTGLPPGLTKGWDYAPGSTVSETVQALTPKLGQLPERPSIDLIQSWLRSDAFERWMRDPVDHFPLVRVPESDAQAIGAKTPVASLSADTMAKQLREHPELTAFDYAEAQRVVSAATHRVQDGPQSMIYVIDETGANGYVLVVKATKTGLGLFVTSLRRLSADEATRDRTIRRLLRKGE
ncbi:virion morphogenesis protein [Sinirhodobacter populi]|uniref:Virion morphogenesis protein n=1 Tax=Paenirhodobacter populi TaxID=2306993 RepID=A0A443K209_9RHOB|nr:phage minor head protein [Sinirhodobacter populi]RWR26797.1 virion morphogenesis protein [Sinirhodobacter populi]